MPQYFKPMLVVDGQPLIVSAIKAARAAGSKRIIVVVAPENAQPIIHLLSDAGTIDHNTYFIVQHTACGPGDAYIQAYNLVIEPDVLLLMADNCFGPNDVTNVAKVDEPVVIGTKSIRDLDVAVRFTRVTPDKTFEGPEIDDDQRWSAGSEFRCWVGPVKIDSRALFEELVSNAFDPYPFNELKIGPYLGRVGKITTVHCTTHDVGDSTLWENGNAERS